MPEYLSIKPSNTHGHTCTQSSMPESAVFNIIKKVDFVTVSHVTTPVGVYVKLLPLSSQCNNQLLQ